MASTSEMVSEMSARRLMLAREKEKASTSIMVPQVSALRSLSSLEEIIAYQKPRPYSDTTFPKAPPLFRRCPFPVLNPTDVYEVELCWEGDDYLHERKTSCKKHPGHTEFIPLREFQKHHLPPHYQDELLVDLVRCLSTLTVRLTVNKISPLRPEPPYPPNPRHDSLGRESSINGSGHVSDAIMYTEDDQKTCSCRECVTSGNRQTRFGKIYIHTAAHVVHNDLEAGHTTCYLLYDDDGGQEKTVTISGMGSVEIDVNEDRCWMFCYTHDEPLVRKLHAMAKLYEQLQEQVRQKNIVNWYNVQETDHKLTIIVSHPHGCGKYISVGQFVERLASDDDPDWTQYTYTTPTCPGSSGAPVFLLGKSGWFDYHHHSGTVSSTGLNISTFGLF